MASQPWVSARLLKLEGASVGFCDLAGEGEANSAAGFLGGEEGHEEVARIAEAGAVVANGDAEESRRAARPEWIRRREGDPAGRRRRLGSDGGSNGPDDGFLAR